jgi:hypothetical protein
MEYAYAIVVVLFVIAIAAIAFLHRNKTIKAELAEWHRLNENAKDVAREERRQIRLRERNEENERMVLRNHPNYNNPQFDPKNPDVLIPII